MPCMGCAIGLQWRFCNCKARATFGTQEREALAKMCARPVRPQCRCFRFGSVPKSVALRRPARARFKATARASGGAEGAGCARPSQSAAAVTTEPPWGCRHLMACGTDPAYAAMRGGRPSRPRATSVTRFGERCCGMRGGRRAHSPTSDPKGIGLFRRPASHVIAHCAALAVCVRVCVCLLGCVCVGCDWAAHSDAEADRGVRHV